MTVSWSQQQEVVISALQTLMITETFARFGDHCFQSAAARLWNRLHPSLQQLDVTCRQFTKTAKVTIVETVTV